MNVDLNNVPEMVQGGALDEMNEFQLMVFIQKITRALTTQRDVSYPVKAAAMDRLCEYLQKRIDQD